jgi:hypothetical protein
MDIAGTLCRLAELTAKTKWLSARENRQSWRRLNRYPAVSLPCPESEEGREDEQEPKWGGGGGGYGLIDGY